MYLSVHGSAALAIARFIPNPIIAFLASLLSHLMLDFIPHGDEFLTDTNDHNKNMKRLLGAAMIDGAVLVIFILVFIALYPTMSLSLMLISLLGGLLPDILQGVYLISKPRWLKGFDAMHTSLHNMPGHKIRWQVGMLVQCLTFTALWVLFI